MLAPEQFNSAFLQNHDLQALPRYASARSFAGRVFEDLDVSSHQAALSPVRLLTVEQQGRLAKRLRRAEGEWEPREGSLSPA
ncbi:hypothetical protein [Deinococcus hopiensis]|uniref:Uncharacterized protein n=1 Tax=Deinococcus hopiensis KR-140 TaxID=695939 RepID=A0A1W1V7W3_9DEIO|nr:hypothetical protein [Deinococcus hopiensis]SMB89448.1 hypothetical protein SAMN00790413_00428 [Deinococcus hopiensis KR-140]